MKDNEHAVMSMRVSDIESKLADAIKIVEKIRETHERMNAQLSAFFAAHGTTGDPRPSEKNALPVPDKSPRLPETLLVDRCDGLRCSCCSQLDDVREAVRPRPDARRLPERRYDDPGPSTREPNDVYAIKSAPAPGGIVSAPLRDVTGGEAEAFKARFLAAVESEPVRVIERPAPRPDETAIIDSSSLLAVKIDHPFVPHDLDQRVCGYRGGSWRESALGSIAMTTPCGYPRNAHPLPLVEDALRTPASAWPVVQRNDGLCRCDRVPDAHSSAFCGTAPYPPEVHRG